MYVSLKIGSFVRLLVAVAAVAVVVGVLMGGWTTEPDKSDVPQPAPPATTLTTDVLPPQLAR